MAVDNDLLVNVNKVINSISDTQKISVRKQQGKKIYVDCENVRSDAREALQQALTKAGIRNSTDIVKGSSELGTHLDSGYQIIYKKKQGSGGIGDTTLNSTITELFPCIGFLTDIRETDPDLFYQKVVQNNNPKLSCYLGDDYKAGKQFIDDAAGSAKFREKVTNAIAILQYIRFQDKGKPIKNVVWGYRLKPAGIPSKHPGDIFVEFRDGGQLGISLKAGGEKTEEPKLNTYVGNVLKDTKSESLYNKWKKESYDKFYTGIPNIPPFSEYGKPSFLKVLVKLEQQNKSLYEHLYDQHLEWLKGKVIDYLNADENRTKDWLLYKIAGKEKLGGVPLVVVKAYGDKAEELNDDDIVEACIQRSKNSGGLKVTKSPTSKQNFFISLTCNAKTTVLNFSIRTNKPGFDHKLGQYIDLAIKFNGVKK